MLKSFSYVLALFFAYFVGWTGAYIAVTLGAVSHLDFTHYFEWFRLAWTFKGFEMVGFTWLLSLILFVPVAIVLLYLVSRLWQKPLIRAQDVAALTDPSEDQVKSR